MHHDIKDMTGPPDLKGHASGTGAIRRQHPVYANLLPPCNHACPAGENIQAWLSLAQAARYEEAWQVLMQDNPMPAVLGRVCYHPCEDHCNRAATDSAVSIHAVERFLGDLALQKGWKPYYEPPPDGKRVLIVGAGPAGLSAAYHLTRMGHAVEIHEAGPLPGGMMHVGIPAYRLPRKELRAEIARMQDMGITIVLNHPVKDILEEKRAGSFDAVFIATGTHLSKKTDIPGRDAGRILDAVSFLKQVEQGSAPKLGRRVAIYGGGNTAMDAARTVQRLGGHEALIIYRRDRDHMTAHDFEAQEALEEGVIINWLRTIKAIDDNQLTVEVMQLQDGRLVPTGQYETLEADSLILALGQEADTAFLKNVAGIGFKPDGTVVVGADMMTGSEGIFAGGDMVPGDRTVTIAVGHGKKAARNIDGYLRSRPWSKPVSPAIAAAADMHTWFKTEAPKKEQASLPIGQRLQGFEEVKAGLDEAEALFEAQRCLSCGNCFECDGCFGSCPEDAIKKLGKGRGYEIDYKRCTGCAVCTEQCPCHAIQMVSELFHHELLPV